jgi:cyclopropane fatty-acyl-phospholipid synthase-like methyltransferase
MGRSHEEKAQTMRWDEHYVRAQLPAMLSIERRVCGCDYGSNSWTTRTEAELMAAHLQLQPGLRLLDVGAGSGWPGLYMAKTSGCQVILVDLPFAGLQIASQRAANELIPGACSVVVCDAALLPFPAASFDAISHSDLLCCLRQKRTVLEGCHDAIRDHGRMVFTVISIAADLSQTQYRRAITDGPEFVEAEADYATLLGETGWLIVERRDITLDYAATCSRQLQADKKFKSTLEALIGTSASAERLSEWRSQLEAIEDGLLRRELFLARPA